jgi:hypothetical protein
MIAIIAESNSDIETLCALLAKMRGGVPPRCVAKRGLRGSGNIAREGEKVSKLFKKLGAKKLLICRDADGLNPEQLAKEMHQMASSSFPGASTVDD